MAAGFSFDDAEALGGWDQGGARTPIRPRERIINLFRSPRNIEYLRSLFAKRVPPGPLRDFAVETLVDSVYAYERIEALIYSDPLAQRGGARPAASLWAEVRRINLAFYQYRMQFIRDKAALISGADRVGLEDEDEPYHYRMFTADSLRPPGLEHLNQAGPLFGIREDQVERGGAPPATGACPPRREGFSATGAPVGASPGAGATPLEAGVGDEDWGWDNGDPHRTPEQALAEYYGEGSEEATVLGAAESTGAGTASEGKAYISANGQGEGWRENGGTRAMRYPTIPIWQNLSRGREYDRDIEETLGTGARETDTHVRRWDRSRMTHPRGEEYRRHGYRSTGTV